MTRSLVHDEHERRGGVGGERVHSGDSARRSA
jgi:hypothetical protein